MPPYFPVPPELLYEILTYVLCSNIHHYVLDEDKPTWDAFTTLLLVSPLFQDTARKVMAHTLRTAPSDETEVSLCGQPKPLLQSLRELAVMSRQDTDSFSKAIADDARLRDCFGQRPFINAYLAYLDAVVRYESLFVDYVEGHEFQDERNIDIFMHRVTAVQSLQVKSVLDCHTVKPAAMCEPILSQIAEQTWKISNFGGLGTVTLCLRSLAPYVHMNDADPSVGEMVWKVISGMLPAIQKSGDDHTWQHVTRYLSLSPHRMREIRQEIADEVGVVDILRDIAGSPVVKKFDQYKTCQIILEFLEKWDIV